MQEQPLIEHLIELRSRLLKSVAAIMVLFFPLYYFANRSMPSWPNPRSPPAIATMIATQVTSPFLAPFKLNAGPFRVSRNLYILARHEFHCTWHVSAGKSACNPLLVSSVLLFYMGVAFAYFVVFPLAFAFFASASPTGVAMMTDINSYLDFVLTLFLPLVCL